MSGAETLIYDEQIRLIPEHFSWNFLRAPPNAWAMSHVLNPFLIQTIFQDWKLTTLFFFVWESVEVFFLTVFGGYEIFVGDTSDYEPIADSLIGDPLGGILGLFMAFMFQIAFKVPRWTPSLYGTMRNVFYKRVLLYLGLIASFLAYNSMTYYNHLSYPIYIGVFISMLLHVIILSISWLWFDRSNLQMNAIWGGWNSDDHRTQIYLGLMSLLVTFQYLGTYYISYVYYQVWAIWGFVMLMLILITAAQGRLWEIYYFWTLEYRRREFTRNSESQLKNDMFPGQPKNYKNPLIRGKIN